MKTHPPQFLLFSVVIISLIASFFVVSKGEAVDCEVVRAQYQCPVKKHKLHLSFDDGVGSVTPKILDVLKRENIKATFLVLGNKIDCKKYRPGKSLELCKQRFQILKRIKREGHDIGSHSYEHHRHSKLSPEELNDTIYRSRTVLAPFFTTTPAVFRLPYGDGWFNQKAAPQVMQTLKKAGFEHLGWEMTAYDWNEKYQHGDQILDNVMGQMCKGRGRDGVVLFHDGVFENEHEGRVFTANNLARWIPSLRCAADFESLSSVRKNFKRK